MAALTGSWSPDKRHSDRERWVCIYPAYINSKKTLAEGRRVPKDKAVENPSYHEMRDILSNGGFNIGVENKLFPRERSKELSYRGRIRVQLKNDDGSPLNPNFPTRDSLLLYLCTNIPKLKTRVTKSSGSDQSQQHGGGGQGGGGAGKKKGKGKR